MISKRFSLIWEMPYYTFIMENQMIKLSFIITKKLFPYLVRENNRQDVMKELWSYMMGPQLIVVYILLVKH